MRPITRLLSLAVLLGFMIIASHHLVAVERAPLFRFAAGVGSADGQALAAGDSVAVGALVQSGAQPLRLVILGARHGHVYLAPNSSLRGEELSDDGRWVLRLVIGRGTVQVDADNLAGSGFNGLVVRGGAVEAEMRGTLFVVQRVRRDADYVALMRGSLTVRDTVAALDQTLRRTQEIELLPNQGVMVETAIGFAEVDTLSGPVMSKALADGFADIAPSEAELADPELDPEYFAEDKIQHISNLLGDPIISAHDSEEDEVIKALGGIESPAGAGSLFDAILGGDLGAALEEGVLGDLSQNAVLDDPPPPPPPPVN